MTLCFPPCVRAETAPDEIVIEALIDGNSELRVKRTGFYWLNAENSKPGKHGGGNQPTYVNGKPWHPVWGIPKKETGHDKSSQHSMTLDPDNLEFVLLAVTAIRGGNGIDKRDEIKLTRVGGEISIFIPDTQSGACWYKFALRKKKADGKK